MVSRDDRQYIECAQGRWDKDCFAAYKKFQERYEFIPKDEDEFVSKLKKKTYPDSSYMLMLEEVYLIFDKDHTIEKLMSSIQFSRKSGFLNCLIIYYLQVLEDDNEGMFLKLEKDYIDLNNIITNRYNNILSFLFNEGLVYFPHNIKIYDLKSCINVDGSKFFVVLENRVIIHIRRDDVLKEYNDLYHKVKSSIQKARETYTKSLTDEEHYHYDIIANERTYLDQIKEMMERKLSLPSNPTD